MPISAFFEQEKDPIAVIKWKEIYENFEEGTDSCEDVANILERIALQATFRLLKKTLLHPPNPSRAETSPFPGFVLGSSTSLTCQGEKSRSRPAQGWAGGVEKSRSWPAQVGWVK